MPVQSRPLLLIPTEMELGILEPLVGPALVASKLADIELCGFGPIVAAARTAEMLVSRRPSRVILAGIAGSYVESLALGAAYVFESVGCYGVGVGFGSQFRTAQAMGWSQWRDDQNGETIDDVIDLATPSEIDENFVQKLMLTVTSAAAEAADCAHRCECFPMATAEDMEAFGVAVACKLRGIPLTVVRGISNRAGDRDKHNWQVEPALQSVADLARRLLTH